MSETAICRRLRMYRVPQQEILSIMELSQGVVDVFPIPPRGWIPPDAVVLSVHHDFGSRSFMVTVAHDSFEEVPDGAYIPTEDEPVCLEHRRFTRLGEACVNIESATVEQMQALRDALDERLQLQTVGG